MTSRVPHLFGKTPPASVRMATRRALTEERMQRNAEQGDRSPTTGEAEHAR